MKRILTRFGYWPAAAVVFGLTECAWVAFWQKDVLLYGQHLSSFRMLIYRASDWRWVDPALLLEVPSLAGLARLAMESVAIYGAIACGLAVIAAILSKPLHSWSESKLGALHFAVALAAPMVMRLFARSYLDNKHHATAHLALSVFSAGLFLVLIAALCFGVYRFARARDLRRIAWALTAFWAICFVVTLLGRGGGDLEEKTLADGSGSLASGPASGPGVRTDWNVVLISIDTLRADHLSVYGYSRPTSPALDRLADEGVLFESCTSTSAWTLPSHMSLMTSTYAYTHGATSQALRGRATLPTLADAFQVSGYATGGVVSNPNVSSVYGFERGFERFDDGVNGPKKPRPAEFVLERGRDFVRSVTDQPFFLFLHLYDVHSPYTPAEPYRSQFVDPDVPGDAEKLTRSSRLFPLARRDAEIPQQRLEWMVSLYDAEIREVDAQLSEFFEFLDQQGLSESTVIAVVSDHGEEFKEHGSLHHGTTVYEEMVRVPCFYRAPAGPSGVRIDQPTSLIDIAPTLLSLVGISPPPTFEGRSMLASLDGGDLAERSTFSETTNFLQRKTIRRENYKLIASPVDAEIRLFDLAADPGETHDLSRELPEVADSLRQELYLWLRQQQAAGRLARANQGQAVLSADVEEQLRALGYL